MKYAWIPARPSRPATTDGSPKMPLPMMEFSTSPVKLQRPMARKSSGRACFAVEAPKDREGGSVACVSSGLTASSVAEHGGLLHPPR